MNRTEPLILLENVGFTYGSCTRPALTGISASIYSGEFVLITGHSGSGKSTLCRVLNGLMAHTKAGRMTGTASVCGHVVNEVPVATLAPEVGIVFQNPESQIFSDDVIAEIAFGPEQMGCPEHGIAARIDEVLGLLGIGYLRGRSVQECSGGELQRIAIASVLATKPRVLVFDEPLASLDPHGARQFIDTVSTLNRVHGITVVIAEHRVADLAARADRGIVLENGRVVSDGPPVTPGAGGNLPPAAPASGNPVPDLPASPVQVPLPRVSVENLSFSYLSGQAPVLDGISFSLPPGRIVALIGPNGSGKTTLVKHLNGLIRPGPGTVRIDGTDVSRKSVAELSRSVGFVFQNPDYQIFSATVAEEIAFGMNNLGIPGGEQEERIKALLADPVFSSLDPASHPLRLSGGEKQRVALAGTLVMGCGVLVLDEPTHGMDGRLKTGLARILMQEKARGTTIVIVTHDLAFTAECADRVIVLGGGKVRSDGDAGEILADADLPGSVFSGEHRASRAAGGEGGPGP